MIHFSSVEQDSLESSANVPMLKVPTPQPTAFDKADRTTGFWEGQLNSVRQRLRRERNVCNQRPRLRSRLTERFRKLSLFDGAGGGNRTRTPLGTGF